MGKITHTFETEYEVGDVVVFEKNNNLQVGVIEGYYVEDSIFWFNIRISQTMVYTYTNKGDIAEYDIIGKLNGELKNDCLNAIKIKERE